MIADVVVVIVLIGWLILWSFGKSAALADHAAQEHEARAKAFAAGFDEGLKLGAEEERRRFLRNVLREEDEPDFVGEAGPVREIADALELQRAVSS